MSTTQSEKDRVVIFDTTLRDGEQCPGASMNNAEKLEVARQLARLNVDVIEAGFPISSPGDFEAVREIARSVKGPVIAALARIVEKDIDRAGEALKPAAKRCIHTFTSASDIHLESILRLSRDQNLEKAVKAVKHAKSYTPDVEFSAQDTGRADRGYLASSTRPSPRPGPRASTCPTRSAIRSPANSATCSPSSSAR